VCIVTVNTAKKAPRWNSVKARIIDRYGSILQASRVFECHPNAIRQAASGRCPNVRKKMEAKGLL
jgi:hypothetical protein